MPLLHRLTRKLDAMLTTQQFTYRALLGIYVPLLLDQVFIFSIGVLATAMVSSSGEAAIAAVNLVSPVTMIVTGLFAGLGSGGAILVARARGANSDEQMRAATGQTMLLCGAASILLSTLMAALAEPILRGLYPKAAEDVLEGATKYMRLFCYSNIPYAVFYAIINVYRGMGDSKASLVLTVAINSVHLVCTLLFINVLKLGVAGSGLSYFAARVVGVVVALLWMFRVKPIRGIRAKYVFKPEGAILRDLLSLGVPLSLEQILFQLGLLVAQVFIATLSTSAVAAYGVTSSVFNLYMAPAFALMTLVTTVCGQCVGAGNIELVRHYTKQLVRVGRVLLALTAALLTPLMPLLLRLYSPSQEALPIIYLSLGVAILPLIVIWCDAYLTAAAMRAAGDSAATTATTLAAMWIGRVAAGYLLAIPLGMGVSGVWVGLGLEWAIRAVAFRLRMRGDRWMKALPGARGHAA